MSGRAPKGLVDGDGELEREITTGGHKYMETEINSRRKRGPMVMAKHNEAPRHDLGDKRALEQAN